MWQKITLLKHVVKIIPYQQCRQNSLTLHSSKFNENSGLEIELKKKKFKIDLNIDTEKANRNIMARLGNLRQTDWNW